MTNPLIVPKSKKVNDTEKVVLPHVKCSVCSLPTTQGLHQIRLILVKKGRIQKNKKTGQLRKIPPVMKKRHFYMCLACVEGKKKWPGKNPIYPDK